MQEILFAPTWWMLTAAGLGAVVLFVYANMRLSRSMRFASVGVLAGTALWWGLGRMVETPMESTSGGTKSFVAAVVARDAVGIGAKLSRVASVGRMGREEIVTVAPQYAEEWGLKKAMITGMEVENRGGQYVSRIRVVSTHEGSRSGLDTLPTDWEFVWAKEPDGWRITEITPLRIGGADMKGVMDQYFSRPRGK